MQVALNEITLLKNLSFIHDRQAAHNNHQELVKLIQHLITRVDIMKQDLNIRLDNVNTRFDNLNVKVTVKYSLFI